RERRHNMDQPDELAKKIADQALWWRANAAHTEEMIAYSSMLRRKYEHSARYPWLAVAPDPAQPYWSGVAEPTPGEPAGGLRQEHAEPDAGGVARPSAIILDLPERRRPGLNIDHELGR